MNYVFRYVGKSPNCKNENRFFYKYENGVLYSILGGYHAPQFSSEVVNISEMSRKLGPNFVAELWTPKLYNEPFYKSGTAPGWWIGLIIVFGLPTLFAIAIWFLTRH